MIEYFHVNVLLVIVPNSLKEQASSTGKRKLDIHVA